MKRASFLLLLFLFISLRTSQAQSSNQLTQLRNHDCKTLFKKQKLQYKIALRDSKLNQRRKKSSIPENKPDTRPNKITKETDQLVVAQTTENIDANKGPLLPINFQKEVIIAGASNNIQCGFLYFTRRKNSVGGSGFQKKFTNTNNKPRGAYKF